jgi:hypothetical protein
MKIAYDSWNTSNSLSSLDVRVLQDITCPRKSLDYAEDLVWTNMTTCSQCKAPHFGSRWRWIKSKNGSVYIPMQKMKAKEAPAYIREVVKKLRRKIRGKSPATPHVLYYRERCYGHYDPPIREDTVLKFGMFCLFERFPKGYEPDPPWAAFFPESV